MRDVGSEETIRQIAQVLMMMTMTKNVMMMTMTMMMMTIVMMTTRLNDDVKRQFSRLPKSFMFGIIICQKSKLSQVGFPKCIHPLRVSNLNMDNIRNMMMMISQMHSRFQGFKLKMDDMGNILIKRLSKSPVYARNTLEVNMSFPLALMFDILMYLI